MSLILPGVAASSRLRAGGSSPYVAKAVHFDGSTWLDIASLTASDSPFLSFSLWLKWSDAHVNGTNEVFTFDPSGNDSPRGQLSQTFSPANDFSVDCYPPVGDGDLLLETLGVTPNVWHSIIYSSDTNHGAGAKLGKFYLDDVDVTNVFNNLGSAFSMLFSGVEFVFGGKPADEFFLDRGTYMDCADVWFAPAVSLLVAGDIPEATRRLFISADGKPIDSSGFPSSAILFSGDSSTFPVNQGTGGAFTLSGSLTNADTSPSD